MKASLKRKGVIPVLLFSLFLVHCSFAVVSCTGREKKVETVRLINVETQQAETRLLKPFIEAVGTLDAFEEVTVSAEVDGMIRSVAVTEGASIGRGGLLASIDDTDYVLEQRRARAALRQTEATLANTRLEFKRKEALHKEELVTRQQFEDVETRLALTEAEVERARAALSLAEQKLAKCRIVSPLSSSVKEKKISAGDYVKNGTALFVMIQANPLKLHFTLAERDVGKVRVGQDLELKVDAYPDRLFKGRVSIVYPSIDEKSRTLKVEALVPNGESLLKPGLFSKVILYTGPEREMVVVPITSLLYEAEKVRLFVVEGDVAREKRVKLGGKYGEVVEIEEGLKPGEKAVTAGQQNLSDGARVSVKTRQAQETPAKTS